VAGGIPSLDVGTEKCGAAGGVDVLHKDRIHNVTQFRGRCPSCGDVVLGVQAVVLLLQPGEDSAGRYCFDCPLCGNEATIGATPATAELLWAAGATVAIDARAASRRS